jgi:hypothetical protein
MTGIAIFYQPHFLHAGSKLKKAVPCALSSTLPRLREFLLLAIAILRV